MEKIHHATWQKGVMADRVINDEQSQPFRRQTVMALLSITTANGWRAAALGDMEATISVTDDAINHMMGVK